MVMTKHPYRHPPIHLISHRNVLAGFNEHIQNHRSSNIDDLFYSIFSSHTMTAGQTGAFMLAVF